MNDLRTAAQQALEALEWISDCHVGDDDDAGECASCHERSYKPHAPDCKKNNAITALRTALRAALAQQAEPVRFLIEGNEFLGPPPAPYSTWGDALDSMIGARAIQGLRISALAQKPQPVQEICPGCEATLGAACGRESCPKGWEAAPQPQQAEPVEPVEPVAWLIDYEDGEREVRFVAGTRGIQRTPLYTAPPQRKLVPLTEAEIEHIGITHQSLRQVARAVERAVWEKNHG